MRIQPCQQYPTWGVRHITSSASVAFVVKFRSPERQQPLCRYAYLPSHPTSPAPRATSNQHRALSRNSFRDTFFPPFRLRRHRHQTDKSPLDSLFILLGMLGRFEPQRPPPTTTTRPKNQKFMRKLNFDWQSTRFPVSYPFPIPGNLSQRHTSQMTSEEPKRQVCFSALARGAHIFGKHPDLSKFYIQFMVLLFFLFCSISTVSGI